ncbi:MAG: 4-carboxymuconolactone decarboxylase, partial [Actinomycetota bacterium]
MSDELFETGLRIRKEVLGEAYVERSLANADDFSKDFQRLVTEYCWGAGWGRSALSKRDRSLLNLVMIGSLNRM